MLSSLTTLTESHYDLYKLSSTLFSGRVKIIIQLHFLDMRAEPTWSLPAYLSFSLFVLPKQNTLRVEMIMEMIGKYMQNVNVVIHGIWQIRGYKKVDVQNDNDVVVDISGKFLDIDGTIHWPQYVRDIEMVSLKIHDVVFVVPDVHYPLVLWAH